MNEQQHIDQLGKLVLNLHAIEGAIRHFLYLHVDDKIPSVDLESVTVGDIVPLNSITDYDSLGRLIDRFNAYCHSQGVGAELSMELVSLRDAIAHGRVLTRTALPMRISKFSRPRNGEVRVEYHQTMDQAWFSRGLDLTTRSIKNVVRASQKFSK